MDLKLKDKVVVITAGTGGCGKALVRAFAEEGCRIAVSSTSQAKLDAFIPELGLESGRIMTGVVDMREEAEVKGFIEAAYNRYGRIDALVVNQGYEGKRGLLEDADMENWLQVFSVNTFGVLYALKYTAPIMKRQHSGAIVINCSHGAYLGSPGLSQYSASKHATYGLAKSATLELAPYGVHVNCICPGGIDTPMIQRIEEMQMPQLAGHEERMAAMTAGTPDKRYCRPEEVAFMALYLASELSAHVNGSGIRLDGGMDARD